MAEFIAGVRISDILILLFLLRCLLLSGRQPKHSDAKNMKRPFTMPKPLCRTKLSCTTRAGSASTILLCICATLADIKSFCSTAMFQNR